MTTKQLIVDSESIKQFIAKRLRQFQVKSCLTNKQIAESLEINPVQYSRYCTGETNPPIELLVKIRGIYGINMNWFLDISLKDELVPKSLKIKVENPDFYCGA